MAEGRMAGGCEGASFHVAYNDRQIYRKRNKKPHLGVPEKVERYSVGDTVRGRADRKRRSDALLYSG